MEILDIKNNFYFLKYIKLSTCWSVNLKILLTNDDGWDAAGITCLFRELVDCGHKVTLVAPEHEKSATSHSLTIFQPLRLRKRAENVYSVNGFPADCVNLAQKVQPAYDLVISGINGGPNMAEDILYSGTIGGAMEAMFLGYKAIALSILDFSDQYFETAARVMCKLLDRGIVNEIAHKSILNINVPNLPLEKIAGIKLAKPGTRLYLSLIHI